MSLGTSTPEQRLKGIEKHLSSAERMMQDAGPGGLDDATASAIQKELTRARKLLSRSETKQKEYIDAALFNLPQVGEASSEDTSKRIFDGMMGLTRAARGKNQEKLTALNEADDRSAALRKSTRRES